MKAVTASARLLVVDDEATIHIFVNQSFQVIGANS